MHKEVDVESFNFVDEMQRDYKGKHRWESVKRLQNS